MDELTDELIVQWEQELIRAVAGGEIKVAQDGSVVNGLLSFMVRALLSKGLTLWTLHSAHCKGDACWLLSQHTLSLAWLQAHYYAQLPTTKLCKRISDAVVPEVAKRFADLLMPAVPVANRAVPYIDEYLSGEEVGVSDVFFNTLARHALPSVVSFVHTTAFSPAINYVFPTYSQVLADNNALPPSATLSTAQHLTNCAVDVFGSTMFRGVGAAAGFAAVRAAAGRGHAHYGAFWGGLAGYYYYVRTVQEWVVRIHTAQTSIGPGEAGGAASWTVWGLWNSVVARATLGLEGILGYGTRGCFAGVEHGAGDDATQDADDAPEEVYHDFVKNNAAGAGPAAGNDAGNDEAESGAGDYYKKLGVERGCDKEVIEKAFRKEALRHHPDRQHDATAEERKEAEERMKDLTNVYTTLKDDRKRRIYNAYLDDVEAGLPHAQPPDPATYEAASRAMATPNAQKAAFLAITGLNILSTALVCLLARNQRTLFCTTHTQVFQSHAASCYRSLSQGGWLQTLPDL